MVTIGMCAAFAKSSVKIKPYKKGPDYIDPQWLSLAAGRSCTNLDFYTQSHTEIQQAFTQGLDGMDLAIIEGNKGLYDGLNLDGSNSNAALAELLKSPVIVVIDTTGITRGIAPLILGYQAFGPELNIIGVILNKVAGLRHEQKLRAAIEHYTDTKILGAIYRDDSLAIIERHLGLVPSNESKDAIAKVQTIATAIDQQVDLTAIRCLADIAPTTNDTVITSTFTVSNSSKTKTTKITIGIIRDEAFGFYYPGDIDAFTNAMVELVEINAIEDRNLPNIDGLFIGGGFPESRMHELQANKSLRQDIREKIECGLPVYAECGGLIYLTRSLTWKTQRAEMVGVIAADTVMLEKPQGKGYVHLQETANSPWPKLTEDASSATICAHEFHYAHLKNIAADTKYAYQVLRGTGINDCNDGIVYKNTLASFAHLRNTWKTPWVDRFITFIRRCNNEFGNS